MKMDLRKTSLFIAILFLAGGAYAADCSTVEEMDAADTAIASIQNWQGVKSFFENYKQCASGSMAEGASAVVARLLASNWNATSQLDAITSHNKVFESWVLDQINTTANDADLELIRDNAMGKCLEENKKICAKIEDAANQALRDLKDETE
ncbi:hypothetical protein FCH31_10805 [Lelliottia amnigena]|uniref:hypothetical protein n=1 Tax=Lelliottia amnigena TaxID=61646 RepID=UPI0015767E76|nr:hypothetical protein [Lelliottia amnigena]NTX69917.1 hypothetical protein [Lelliottia amnigena]